MNINLSRYAKSMAVAMAFLGAQTAHSQVLINELMQSNIDCVMDDINEFPDSWVEIYNSGNATVNLRDYSIGDSEDPSKAWQLPSCTLSAHGYQLIYCDKEANGLHTDFRLETGKGGAVYLFCKGELIDKVMGLKKQPAPNIAYGRETSGASKWGYMLLPTPAAANSGGIGTEILGDPIFNVEGGVSTTNRIISLSMSLPEGSPEGTQIRYTLDGSEPTEKSLLYTSAIRMSGNRVVRARLFCNGYLSPRSTVRSFLSLDREITLPVISIVTDNKYLNDPKIGIYVDGTYSSSQKNYRYDWRRPINIEMYEKDGTTCVLNQLCETRIMGAATRDLSLKSMAIYANKRFGTKRFEYEFFPEQRPGVKNFKSLGLRNAGNDFDYLYMRDAIIQSTMAKNTDVDFQAWRPAIVFINGVYKGMLNIRERSNDDNVFTNYDELEDIDMFENWGELKNGTWDNLNAFTQFYNEHGHTMAEFDQWMDVKEFINVMAANLFYANLDFPGNNIVMWRPRAEGGRWRWIMKDTDFGLGLYDRPVSYNTIAWINDNNYDSNNAWGNTWEATRLFRRLMEDADFQREFIDHCAIYMGDFLNERGTREVWDPMYEEIKAEYPKHRELYNRWWPNYDEELSKGRNWIKNRPSNFYKYITDYYKVGSPVAMTINKNVADEDIQGVGIYVNGIRLTKGRFDGKFFQNRDVTVSGVTEDGREVTGWRFTTRGQTTEVDGAQYSFKMPATSVSIEAITKVSDGIEDIELYPGASTGATAVETIYDAQGRKVQQMLSPGMYLLKMTNGSTRKMLKK